MCGIAGYNVRGTVPGLDSMAHAMLLGIEERGRDASGIAWREPDGQVWIAKNAVPGGRFIASLGADAPSGARVLIAHTRFATLGEPSENVNNHPIENNGVVGIHNGVITNHADVFSLLEAETDGKVQRHGEVDSEAIFALLAWRKRLGLTAPEALELLQGSYAIAWVETGGAKNVLHLARGVGSPLVVGHTAKGSLLFASTEHALKKAAMAGGFRIVQIDHVPEGTYLKVASGKIVDVQRFTPQAYRYYAPNYNRSSSYVKPKPKTQHNPYRTTKGERRAQRKRENRNGPVTVHRRQDRAWYGTNVENEAWHDYANGLITWKDYEELRGYYESPSQWNGPPTGEAVDQ